MHPLVETQRSEILALAEHHGLRDVCLFGSMARDDSNDASDMDLLVTLAPGATGLALGGISPFSTTSSLASGASESTQDQAGPLPLSPLFQPRSM